MKKIFLTAIFLFLIITLIGCDLQVDLKSNSINEDIIKKVKIYEKNEYLMSNLEITYNQYKENVKNIVIQSFTYKDNETIFAYDGKIYKGIDLIGISPEELKKHKRNLEKYMQGSGNLPSKITYQISKVYDDKFRQWKYIAVKKIMTYDNHKTEVHINKVYTFKKENEEWKIMRISENYINWSDEIEKKQEITKEEYTKITINNETVEFIEGFNPIESK